MTPEDFEVTFNQIKTNVENGTLHKDEKTLSTHQMPIILVMIDLLTK